MFAESSEEPQPLGFLSNPTDIMMPNVRKRDWGYTRTIRITEECCVRKKGCTVKEISGYCDGRGGFNGLNPE